MNEPTSTILGVVDIVTQEGEFVQAETLRGKMDNHQRREIEP